MNRTVVAIYDDFQTAKNAVHELVDNGFSRDAISIIANDARGEFSSYKFDKTTPDTTPVADETGAGASVGAGIGAAIGGLGGLLVGIGALTIPGIGPVIAAGPLAVALSTLTGAGVGAVTGGVTGGLLGALVGLGVPETEAQYYAEGVRRGGVLVTVVADQFNAHQITNILNRFNPLDIKERASQWREQGWTGFDPNAEPYTDNDLERERQGLIANTGADVTYDRDTEIEMERAAFDPHNNYYRTHYNTFLYDIGLPYDDYVPAYRYGYELASNPDFRGRRWEDIETDVSRDWELDFPGTWDRFKAAIRHAWQDLTD